MAPCAPSAREQGDNVCGSVVLRCACRVGLGSRFWPNPSAARPGRSHSIHPTGSRLVPVGTDHTHSMSFWRRLPYSAGRGTGQTDHRSTERSVRAGGGPGGRASAADAGTTHYVGNRGFGSEHDPLHKLAVDRYTSASVFSHTVHRPQCAMLTRPVSGLRNACLFRAEVWAGLERGSCP